MRDNALMQAAVLALVTGVVGGLLCAGILIAAYR